MGGHAAGEVASAIATSTIIETDFLNGYGGDLLLALGNSLSRANRAIFEEARRDRKKHGMGTTCVAALIRGSALYVAHVGDCRAYIIDDTKARRLTQDHSWVGEQIRAGLMDERQAHESSYRSVITRALGIAPDLEPDMSSSVLLPGETLLLCSDGLWDVVSDELMVRTVRQFSELDAAAERLVELAKDAGGPDNISVMLARVS
jgi:serine/threonine protein phosphatase PrpC